MFGQKIVVKRGGRDEAEKPFWISFADLMTALMILFLVVMGVALLAVTKTVTERERKEEEHLGKIEQCLDGLAKAAKSHEGVNVDKFRHAIDYGQRAQFAFDDWRLNAQQEEVLRRFVPEILKQANEESCRSTLKRVLVEGYTDKTGSYL